MKVRLDILSFTAAALAAAAFAGEATAAAPSLCNADGKIEVLAEPSPVACGEGAKAELRALLKARSRYQNDGTLGWKERAMIVARIDRRVGDLRLEMRRPGD